MSEKQLRHPKLLAPFRGVRVLPTEDGTNQNLSGSGQTLQLAHYFAPLLTPGAALSHTTALVLYGCPIRVPVELHVTVPDPVTTPRRKGVIGHRHRGVIPVVRSPVNPAIVVARPDLALMQAAATLPFTELVVAIDHLITSSNLSSDVRPDPDQLRRAFERSSLRGIVKAREALRRSRVGAESRMETILRLKLEAEGIAGLDLQVEIHDADGFIGRFDLVDRTHRIIYEYDGEQHRTDREQYLKDQHRLDRVRDAGWRVIRFHHEDLFSEREVFRRKLAW